MAAGSSPWGGFDHHEIYGDHFMEYLDLIDFPMESLEGGGLDQGDWDARMQVLGTILVEAKPLLGSPLASPLLGSPLASVGDSGNATLNVVPCNNDSATSNVVPSLSVHTEVSSEVKPPINFIKEASEASIRLHNDPSHVSESEVFQSPSQVSLPESTSSCSGDKSMSPSSENLAPAHTTHTKHSESSTIVHPQLRMPPISCTGKRQPRKRKFSQPSGTFSNSKTMMQNSSQRPAAASKKCSVGSSSYAPSRQKKYARKCLHCEAGKTPQWRGGPMGPNTLCNACGVRYRTGRLLPEYRPAASPSFVPSLHSNSHRKVIQMSKKCCPGIIQGGGRNSNATATTTQGRRGCSPG